MKKSHVTAVLLGGFVAGLLDIIFAISFAAYNGTEPVRLLQIVASGMFGRAAFEGGNSMAGWGLALHFVMSFMWAAAFVLVASKRSELVRRPYVSGILFGVLVFFTMRLVVLPLSAFPFPVTVKSFGAMMDLVSHILFFGLPIAIATRNASRPVTAS